MKVHKVRGRAGGVSKGGLYRLIDENCKFCIWDRGCEGSWRAQVEACTEVECALYLVRPVVFRGVKDSG